LPTCSDLTIEWTDLVFQEWRTRKLLL